MEKITNIEINNFKSIRHAEIKDCRRINLFIGYPNVGKSNILEALSLTANDFKNSGKMVSLKNLCRYEELIGLFNDGNKQKEIEIIVDNFVYLLKYWDRNTVLYDVIEKGFFLSNRDDYKSMVSRSSSVNQLGDFTPFSYNTQRNHPTTITRRYHFQGLQKIERSNPMILDFPLGNNLFEVLRYNADIRKTCGELFSNYELKLAFDEDTKLKVQKQLDEYSVFQIPLMQTADTLQRLIFYTTAILSNKSSILLFEEPEAHMFPPYIRKMTADIVMDKNGNQFFIATHSPYVLDELMAEAADDVSIYLVDYKDGETKIIHLSNEDFNEIREYGVDLFFNIESYLKHGQVNNA